MKRFKTFLLPFVILAILLFCPSPKTAQAAGTSISLHNTKTVTLQNNESITYSFSPTQTGDYVLWVGQDDAMYNLAWGVYYKNDIYRPYCNRFLQESYEGGVYTLEAGKTYDIKF